MNPLTITMPALVVSLFFLLLSGVFGTGIISVFVEEKMRDATTQGAVYGSWGMFLLVAFFAIKPGPLVIVIPAWFLVILLLVAFSFTSASLVDLVFKKKFDESAMIFGAVMSAWTIILLLIALLSGKLFL